VSALSVGGSYDGCYCEHSVLPEDSGVYLSPGV